MDGYVYLARLTVTHQGKKISVRAMDIIRVEGQREGTSDTGAKLHMAVGSPIDVSDTFTAIETALATLWSDAHA